jgi:phosphatidylglycerol lysyltransferase
LTRDELEGYLREFGSHALAYSALQVGLSHFTIKGVGYVPYSTLEGDPKRAYVLSNPICARSDYALITEKFLIEFPRAAFIQITEEYAEVLDSLGFYVNELGYETEISLKDYSYSGRIKEDLRRGLKRAKTIGMVVEEVDDVDGIAEELSDVSNDWMSKKRVASSELRFVARPAVYDKEAGVRKFIAKLDGRVEGFVFFDPMFDAGRVYGYHLDILRARTNAHPSTRRLIIKRAMEVFRNEGHEILSLGISPELLKRDERFNHSPVTRRALELLYNHGNSIYPFKNLTFAKSRYGGGMMNGEYRDSSVRKKKVYFAHRARVALREMYGASRLTGVTRGFIPALARLVDG